MNFTFIDNEERIEFMADASSWRCTLSDYRCEKLAPAGPSFGRPDNPEEEPPSEYANDVVDGMVDLSVQAQQGQAQFGPGRSQEQEPRAKTSPDGKWEALIQNYNVFIRPKGQTESVALSLMAQRATTTRSRRLPGHRILRISLLTVYVFLRYRGKDGAWVSADTAQLAQSGTATFAPNADGRNYTATYQVLYAPPGSNTETSGTRAKPVPILTLRVEYTFEEQAIVWNLTIQNVANAPREIDDLAYNGLITDWNMESKVLLSPDNYDRIQSWRICEVTCDDPGLGKPAYLAAKNAEFLVQSEVEALDYYIQNFVWGGLQQTTTEPYPYGIYGIPDWKTNRDSTDPGRNGQRHLWRIYDYPHVVLLYYSMYRIAKNYPQIKTALPPAEYLRRAYGTANALFTVPMEIEHWSAYRTGLYNERIIVDLIADLQAEGMTAEAEKLKGHWEQKVKTFVNGELNLFQSEYAFDSTGFEATHALARYAIEHADRGGENRSGIPLQNAQRFMQAQLQSNIFCRGWLEPAYYYLGSDYRGGGGNSFTLS